MDYHDDLYFCNPKHIDSEGRDAEFIENCQSLLSMKIHHRIGSLFLVKEVFFLSFFKMIALIIMQESASMYETEMHKLLIVIMRNNKMIYMLIKNLSEVSFLILGYKQ